MMQRKGVESFIYVLVAALFLLALGALFAGGLPELRLGGPAVPEGVSIIPTRTVFADRIGTLGITGEQTSHIRLGDFFAGYTLARQRLIDEPEVQVARGVFTDVSHARTFSGKDALKAVLDFKVADTNAYGDLQIWVNGALFRTISRTGTYSIEILDIVKDQDNEIVVTAASSGLRFWAPTTYILHNFTLSLETLAEQRRDFAFTLTPQQVLGWSTGGIYFWVDQAKSSPTGNLSIEVNGNPIFNEKPAGVVLRDFSRAATAMRPGENTIAFRTEPGKNATYSINAAEIIVTYFGTGEEARATRLFTLDPFYQELLTQEGTTAELTFRVEDVLFDAGMLLSFNAKNVTYGSLIANRTYTVPLVAGDFKDSNKIELVTTGAYRLGDLRVVIRQQ